MSTFHASSVEEIRAALKDPAITVITVEPGDYYVADTDRGQGFVIDRDVEIVSSTPGEHANFHARADFLKGIFLVESGASATFDGIGFHDTRALYDQYQQGNEAGIRHEGDNLIIKNSVFTGNSNGILGSEVDHRNNKNLVIENSVFEDNGNTDQEHHVYFIGNSAAIDGSTFTNSNNGHAVKTVVSDFTKVTNSIIDDSGSIANHAINVTGGGDLIVSGNEIYKSATSDNPYVIFYVPQRGDDSGIIQIENNTIHTEWDGSTGGTLLLGNFSSSVAELSNNTLTGSFATNLVYGIAEDAGSTVNGEPLSDSLWLENAAQLTAGRDSYTDGNDINPDLYADAVVRSVNGGDGNDHLVGQSDDRDVDVFLGGDGNDFIDGGGGVDFLYGEEGDDVILLGTSAASSPVDFASGGDGNDWIISGSDVSAETSAAFISGGNGDDFIDASRSYSGIFAGDAGNDIILGATYRDWLNGGSGDDFLYGGLAFDHLLGGEGVDTAIYAGAYGIDLTVQADYRAGDVRIIALGSNNAEVGGGGSETATDFEYIQFSNGVLDTYTLEFTEGAERISLSELLDREIPTYESVNTNTVTETASNGTVIASVYFENRLISKTETETDGDIRTTAYDEGGARTSMSFVDGSDAQNWTSFTNTYDVQTGKIASQEFLFDNGNTRHRNFTDGTLTEQVVTEADGDIVTVLFDEQGNRTEYSLVDVSDTRKLSSYTATYDAQTGAVTSRERFFDKGNSRIETFADGTLSSRVLTDADGDIKTSVYGENGVRESFSFIDVSDTRNWASYSNTYDVQTGKIASQERHFDNGDILLRTFVDGKLVDRTFIPAPPRPSEDDLRIAISETTHTLTGEGSLFGTDGNDFILPDSANTAVYGEAGNDVFSLTGWGQRAVGGEGDDVFLAHERSQTLSGGEGADTFVIAGPFADVVVTDFDVTEDMLYFIDGVGNILADSDIFANATDTADGVSIASTVGTVRLTGVSLTDLRTADVATFDTSRDVEITALPTITTTSTFTGPGWLYGTAGSDRLETGANNIVISGLNGDDHLVVSHSWSRAEAGGGDDLIEVNAQDAILVGGEGDDVFHFTQYLDGVLRGYEPGHDVIAFDGALFGISTPSEILARIGSDIDGNAVLYDPNGIDTIVFEGVDAARIDEEDFLIL